MQPQAKAPFAGLASILAKFGQGGDKLLAHITPHEAELLKARGGIGDANPHTGALEFFEGSDSTGGTGERAGNPDNGASSGPGTYGGAYSTPPAGEMEGGSFWGNAGSPEGNNFTGFGNLGFPGFNGPRETGAAGPAGAYSPMSMVNGQWQDAMLSNVNQVQQQMNDYTGDAAQNAEWNGATPAAPASAPTPAPAAAPTQTPASDQPQQSSGPSVPSVEAGDMVAGRNPALGPAGAAASLASDNALGPDGTIGRQTGDFSVSGPTSVEAQQATVGTGFRSEGAQAAADAATGSMDEERNNDPQLNGGVAATSGAPVQAPNQAAPDAALGTGDTNQGAVDGSPFSYGHLRPSADVQTETNQSPRGDMFSDQQTAATPTNQLQAAGILTKGDPNNSATLGNIVGEASASAQPTGFQTSVTAPPAGQSIDDGVPAAPGWGQTAQDAFMGGLRTVGDWMHTGAQDVGLEAAPVQGPAYTIDRYGNITQIAGPKTDFNDAYNTATDPNLRAASGLYSGQQTAPLKGGLGIGEAGGFQEVSAPKSGFGEQAAAGSDAVTSDAPVQTSPYGTLTAAEPAPSNEGDTALTNALQGAATEQAVAAGLPAPDYTPDDVSRAVIGNTSIGFNPPSAQEAPPQDNSPIATAQRAALSDPKAKEVASPEGVYAHVANVLNETNPADNPNDLTKQQQVMAADLQNRVVRNYTGNNNYDDQTTTPEMDQLKAKSQYSWTTPGTPDTLKMNDPVAAAAAIQANLEDGTPIPGVSDQQVLDAFHRVMAQLSGQPMETTGVQVPTTGVSWYNPHVVPTPPWAKTGFVNSEPTSQYGQSFGTPGWMKDVGLDSTQQPISVVTPTLNPANNMGQFLTGPGNPPVYGAPLPPARPSATEINALSAAASPMDKAAGHRRR